MHSVQRSPEPDFLAQLQASHSQWDELDGGNRRRVRDALAQDFNEVCAYCEQRCDPVASSGALNAETIDHFRPRSWFPHLWLNWDNLIYACYRCNQSKRNNWPGYEDAMTNKILEAMYPRYTVPSEYVNPNASDGVRPAHEFFDLDMDSCEIVPAGGLDDSEWSAARRTIWDVDLNDTMLAGNDPKHFRNQRRYQQYLLVEGLNSLDDTDLKIQMISAFVQPDKPFSSFIYAYLTSRFPDLSELLPRY